MEAKTDLRAIGQLQHGAKAAEAKLLYKNETPVKASLWDPETKDSWKNNINTKLVHFIRHGQGYHNLLGEVTRDYGATFSETGDYELAIKENCPYLLPGIQDPPLTTLGRADAKAIRTIAKDMKPELYIVSPMKRATETILIGFKDQINGDPSVPVIAHEGCREQLGVFLCDKRSELEDYKEAYTRVNYDLMVENEDSLWKMKQRETMLEMAYRADSLLSWIFSRPEREVVVGTHSAWLMSLYNVALDVDESSESLKTFFRTGEMRSTLLTFDPKK